MGILQALLQQAGTHSGAGQVDPLCWENFRAWFSKGLKTLHQVTHQALCFTRGHGLATPTY